MLRLYRKIGGFVDLNGWMIVDAMGHTNIYRTLGPTSVLYSSRRVKLAATANTMMRTQVARVMPQERCCWGLHSRGLAQCGL